jgi:hypothetical protein
MSVESDASSTSSSRSAESMRDWERQAAENFKFVVRREMEGSKLGKQRAEIAEFKEFVKEFFPHFEGVDDEHLSTAVMEVKKGEGVILKVEGLEPIEVRMGSIPDRKFGAITSLFPHLYSNELLSFVYPKMCV